MNIHGMYIIIICQSICGHCTSVLVTLSHSGLDKQSLFLSAFVFGRIYEHSFLKVLMCTLNVKYLNKSLLLVDNCSKQVYTCIVEIDSNF
jgi:hypothetical protein